MDNPRVLVITDNSILGYALSNLLRPSQGHVAVQASNVKTASKLASAINLHNPDIILVGITNPLVEKEVLNHFLLSNLNIPMVLVHEDSNWVQVIHREEILMSETEDLIKLIDSL